MEGASQRLCDLDNPTTQALVEWGIQNRHLIEQFKVGHDSGQEGKGMTIYFGSHADMMSGVEAIERLEEQGKIKLANPGKDAAIDDLWSANAGKY